MRERKRERERGRKSHPRYVCTPLNNCGSFAQIIPGVSASTKVKYNNTAGEHTSRACVHVMRECLSRLSVGRFARTERARAAAPRVRAARILHEVRTVRGRSLPRKRAYVVRDTYAEHTKCERAFKSPSYCKIPQG